MELLIVVIIGIYVYLKISRLESRLDKFESGKQEFTPLPIPSATPQTGELSPARVDELKEQYVQKVQPSGLDKFVNWVKEDFMVKVGALLLLIAFGWFVSYAFANNWIGPAGRIVLGLFVGVIFLGLGTWRINSYRHQGGIFTIVGATTILLTIFAAREMYDFFTPLSALVTMFMTVVFVAFVSVRYNTEKLAFAGLVLGSIAPLLTRAPIPDTAGLFTYLMIIALGTLWVVWVTGWTRLTFTSLIITYLYSSLYLLDGVIDREVAMTFSFLFVSLFFAANMVSLVRRHGQGMQHMKVHTLTALGTAIFLFTWIEAAATPEWKSLLYVAWALVFAVGAYVVFLFTANRSAFYLYGATSIALIGVATAAELNGPALTIAYLLEISLLIIAAGKIMMKKKLITQLSFLLVVPVLLSLESLSSYRWHDSILHEHFVVVSLTAVMLLAVGMFIRSLHTDEESGLDQFVSATLLVGGGFYTMSLVWLVFHALLASDLATMLSLITYTIVGITFFVQGKLHDKKFFRWSGATLVALVVARLLLIEVWNMNLEGRIITFVIIGIMLISTAFIRKLHPQNEGQSNNPLQ